MSVNIISQIIDRTVESKKNAVSKEDLAQISAVAKGEKFFHSNKIIGDSSIEPITVSVDLISGKLLARKVIPNEAEYKIYEKVKEIDGIAKCVYFGPCSSGYELLTEFCSHGDISEILQESKKSTKTPRKTIFKKIQDAIAKLHAIGIVHQDLYGRNILLNENDEPQIIDFGNALLRDSTTDANWNAEKADELRILAIYQTVLA